MPYRIPELPERAAPPPREHEYAPIHRQAMVSAGPAMIVTLPIMVGAIVAGVGFPIAGVIAAVGAGFGLWWFHKRSKTRGRVRLSVHKGSLLVMWADRAEGDEIRLRDLLDVALDTKTIERIQDGSALIPALQAINATVGPPADTARIALYTADRAVYLTDEFLAYTETSDAIAKMRVFLRKNGWVPADEREEAEPRPKRKKKRAR